MNRAELKSKARVALGNDIFNTKWLYAVLTLVIAAAATGLINVIPGIGSIAAILVAGPIMYGSAKIFLNIVRTGEKANLNFFIDGFKDNFGDIFLLGLMQTIFITLWSLLFIIPGIVKSLAYSMAFYIKNDHPEYDWKQCLDESQRMMKGHKWELFVLKLSFLGWLIVGSLCLGVGTFWVEAYMETTVAGYYEELKKAPVIV